MRRSRRLICLATGIGLPLVAAACRGEADPLAPIRTLESQIELSAPAVRTGDTLGVTITVHNPTPTAVTLPIDCGGLNFIVRTAGTATTRFGPRAVICALSGVHHTVIAPGQSLSRTHRWPVSLGPDEYEVIGGVHVGQRELAATSAPRRLRIE